jgi:hypothetical protein
MEDLMCCVDSPREGAPLFGRGGALQEEIAHILKGGAPLTLWLFHVLIDWMIGRGGSPSSHTWHYFTLQVVRPPSPHGAPSFIGNCYILKHSSPL